MTIKAVVLNPNDNVAVALTNLEAGTALDLRASGQVFHVRLEESIPYQHKFSVTPIGSGCRIIKYGVVIGEATQDIKQGRHVHIHNMVGLRVKTNNK